MDRRSTNVLSECNSANRSIPNISVNEVVEDSLVDIEDLLLDSDQESDVYLEVKKLTEVAPCEVRLQKLDWSQLLSRCKSRVMLRKIVRKEGTISFGDVIDLCESSDRSENSDQMKVGNPVKPAEEELANQSVEVVWEVKKPVEESISDQPSQWEEGVSETIDRVLDRSR